METGIDDARSRPTCPAVVKLRTLFQDKSKTALNAAFNEFVNKLCYRNSEKAIVVKDCNSLNLIEFKIAIMKTFRDVFLFTEVKDIFIFFDSSRTGRVQRDQFITGMRVRSFAYIMSKHLTDA